MTGRTGDVLAHCRTSIFPRHSLSLIQPSPLFHPTGGVHHSPAPVAQHASAIDILADYRSLCAMDPGGHGPSWSCFGVMLANSIESTQQDLELLEEYPGLRELHKAEIHCNDERQMTVGLFYFRAKLAGHGRVPHLDTLSFSEHPRAAHQRAHPIRFFARGGLSPGSGCPTRL